MSNEMKSARSEPGASAEEGSLAANSPAPRRPGWGGKRNYHETPVTVRVPRVMGAFLRDEAQRRNVDPGDILKEPVEAYLSKMLAEWSNRVVGQSLAQQAEAA